MSESRPKKYYWEDFAVGTVREFGGMTLEKADIVRFARDWDPQPFHVDEEGATRVTSTPCSSTRPASVHRAWRTSAG